LEKQHELTRIDRRFLKSKVKIKAPGPLIDCMNQHCTYANNIGCLFDSRQRIEQERFT